MGSSDKSLNSHIWGLEGVLPGHIYSQGTKLTKMFLGIYMSGVSDNKEAPCLLQQGEPPICNTSCCSYI